MLAVITKLLSLLTPRQRRQLLRLQLLVVLAAVAEVVGVASVGPFMAVVADPARLQSSERLSNLFMLLGATSQAEMIFWLGIGVVVALTAGGALAMLSIWRLTAYAQRVGASLGNRLFRHYLTLPWLFHTSTHSAQLAKQITQESARVTHGILTPLLHLNARLVMALLMSVALLAYQPVAAGTGIAIMAVGYLILYRGVRQRLARNGQRISAVQRERYTALAEGLGGIVDILLLRRQDTFAQRFTRANDDLARYQAVNQALALLPRHAMEVGGFVVIVLLILYLLSAKQGNLAAVLPVLAVFALAGLKLLPAFQHIYASAAQIRGNLAGFEAIEAELRASLDEEIAREESGPRLPTPSEERLSHRVIALRNVTLTYPGKSRPALNKLSLELPAGRVIGLVGASGSGKSTAIGVLLCLLKPQEGQVEVDGAALSAADTRRWQNALGYVPQSIFLADASIRENIAFGLPPREIDPQRVERALRLAHLEAFVSELPRALETRVGERGLQLSGGQRQRLGIARALYRDPDVLIMDEATNALDGLTEKYIMDDVHAFSGRKTVVLVAHRLNTVKKCDVIYLLADGHVIDHGSYTELMARNDTFRQMAASG
jgi:ATP-binding cassette, subfamily B, bacterial PglK